MYDMDLIIILALIIVIAFFFRDYKHAVYFLGICEILFRLIHFIGDNLHIKPLNEFIDNYIPSSLFSIIAHYSSGLLYEILKWVLVILFGSFLVYLIRYFFKR